MSSKKKKIIRKTKKKKSIIPVDILGIGLEGSFVPYETNDGWIVVTPGAESGRRTAGGKKLLALSKVEINLDNKKDVEKCIEHLKESDRRFTLNPNNLWDWQSTSFKGTKIRFAVEWYDLDFFSRRKEAYKSTDHAALYSMFGATVQNLKVKHFFINGNGQETPA